MTSEGSEELACLSVPQFNALIETSRDEEEAIGAESYLNNQALMTSEALQRFGLLLGLPHEHCQVVRSRHQHFSFRISSLLISLHSVLLHSFEFCVFISINAEVLLLVIEAACSQHVIGTQRQRVDPMCVAL